MTIHRSRVGPCFPDGCSPNAPDRRRSPLMMHALDPAVHGPIFKTIVDLIPPPPTHPLGCHRQRVSDRLCFTGILLRLVTGASWETIEFSLNRQVSDTTLRARRDEWIAAGVRASIS